MTGTSYAVDVRNISKTFKAVRALNQVSLRVMPGEMVALIGPSGSGKSTLLRHLSGLITSDRVSSAITLLGQPVQTDGAITPQIRQVRADVGFIFQQVNLVGRLPLLSNVLVGMLAQVPIRRSLVRWFTHAEKQAAMYALARVDMADYAMQRANTLSGGQQQRGAIARAMVQKAKILLADEPIASLDLASARRVMESLTRLNQEDGVTVLVSLHQIDFAMRYCPRSVALKDGRVVYDGPTIGLTVQRLRDIYGDGVEEFYEAETPSTLPSGGAYPASVSMP